MVVSGDRRATEVVSTGAFRYVRHPLYLGSILIYFGMTVSTASVFCLTLLVLIALFYDYIAGYEEKLLELKLGPDYTAYKKKTGKWIPNFGRKS